ncbi:hypothetical protein FEM03_07285 [Phragmitibacter flavus]|uniref:Uncharacterized protein n=1 Tax=Phragmitibacter flavus TaxID=2576071 RepID=A0A5R8KGA5_9BACT|nr:hypothetical protein [Phragmitibacter flavus]TLD71326.1 hypothetical protein FEM03_07285 [Phragmitibacter flavus]
MKKTYIYLLIVTLLITGTTGVILYFRWQQQHQVKDESREDARNFRKAEKALDDVFQLPTDMQRKPPPQPKEP